MSSSLSGFLGPAAEADVPPDAVVVMAQHDPPWATARAVEDALLGEERLERAAHRLRATLHELRHGDHPEARWRERWRRAAPGRPVVVTQAEELDPETARFLSRAALGLGHPVQLVFGQLPPSGPARMLADDLGLRAPSASSIPLPTDTDVRLVLRACAAVGSPFEVGAVARRLGRAPVRVLEGLQQAVDAGVPVADHGDGRLSLPDEVAWALAEGLLPSLAAAWQEPPPAAPVDASAAADAPTTVPPRQTERPPAGEPEARVRDARAHVEAATTDARARGLAKLELARSLRARPGLGVPLTEATEAARQAVALLAGADVHERAAAQVTLAHLLVEHGAPGSLDEALDEVVAASRALGEAGDAEGAAALLNDQAEVWLKLGDPVRAARLLHGAEESLAGRHDALSVVERAETDHLMARLPLYAPAREGLEGEAIQRALERLGRAEATYRQAGWVDREAHVLDTRGRLLSRDGQVEAAARALQSAAARYRQLGDGLGLARVTEGLATMWIRTGHERRAVALLEQSLVLNTAAASPVGLAYVRRAVERLPTAERARFDRRLLEAEVRVGRVELPPEA